MSIVWFVPRKNPGIITISNYGFTFNKNCFIHLKDVNSISFGFDLEKNRVLIQKKDDEKGFKIPKIKENTNTIRVSCKSFVQYLENNSNLEFQTKKRFYLEFDEQENTLFFDLNVPIKTIKNL